MKSSRRSFVKHGLLAGSALVPAPAPAAQSAAAPRSAGERFRQLLEGPDVLQCPVVFDALSAKMSEDLGFPAIFAGGQPVSASMYGAGDFGSLTMTELIEFAGRIAGVVDIPVVGDADDGGGNPLNVHRTIQSYERVGRRVRDDRGHVRREAPSRSPGGADDAPFPPFVDKIKAAVDARKHGLVLIARSDALSAKEPFEKGVERLAAYAEAGADVVFLAGAPIRRTPELAKASKRPVMTVTMPTDPDSSPDVVRSVRRQDRLLRLSAHGHRDGSGPKSAQRHQDHGTDSALRGDCRQCRRSTRGSLARPSPSISRAASTRGAAIDGPRSPARGSHRLRGCAGHRGRRHRRRGCRSRRP